MADLIIRQSDSRVLDHGDSIVDDGDHFVKQISDAQINIAKSGIAYPYSLVQGAPSVPADLLSGVGVVYDPDPSIDPPPPPPDVRHYDYIGGDYIPTSQTEP